MANWLNVLNKRMAKYPLRLAVGFSMFKAGTADIFTQSILEKRPEVDLKRTSVFLTFGCIYQGFFQYFLWNIAFERIFPGASLVANLQKVAVTNLIGDPLFFFPTFYTVREALIGPKHDSSFDLVRAALGHYANNYIRDWMTSWTIWFPGHTVTYFLMPIHLRVPWVATASFGYVCILSYLRGDQKSESPQTDSS